MKKFFIALFIFIIVLVGVIVYCVWTSSGFIELRAGMVMKVNNIVAFFRDKYNHNIPEMRSNFTQDCMIFAGKWDGFYSITNFAITVSNISVPVRVYQPREGTNFPVVVFFHGGGFVLGDLDSYDNVCRQMSLKSGFIVLSAGYRLAPENPYPAAVNDSVAVFRWLLTNSAKINASSNLIFMAGDSAGGNLAANLCLKARDARLKAIIGQVLIYPWLDASRMDYDSYKKYDIGFTLSKKDMEWFRSCYVPDPASWTNADVSPLLARDLSNLPPTLVITAEYDVLRDEGEKFASNLTLSGVSASLIRFPGIFHGFISLDGVLPVAKTAGDRIVDFMKETASR